MIERLDSGEIVEFIRTLPEQSKVDCKADLRLDNDYLKSELVKDITAIANAHGDHVGYLFYGIDLAKGDPVVGIKTHHDDATLQQIVAPKLEHAPSFLYYEASIRESTIGVVVIPPSNMRPHIIRTSYGKLHAGGIPIRRGSSTTWSNSQDLRLMHAAATDVVGVGELVMLASDPSIPTSALAVRAWNYATDAGHEDAARVLKLEITGYGPDHGPEEVPKDRTTKTYVTSTELRPGDLLIGPIETLARLPGLQEAEFIFDQSLAELESYTKMSSDPKSLLHIRQQMKTVADGEAEAFIYFPVTSIESMISSIRNRITGYLMEMKENTS